LGWCRDWVRLATISNHIYIYILDGAYEGMMRRAWLGQCGACLWPIYKHV
jgi:hypothetical protein